MVEGVLRWIGECRQLLPPGAVRLIVHAPASFVDHDIALVVELCLRHGRQQLTHAIGLEPERYRQLVRWHRLEVVGAIEPGGTVQRTAGALHELEVLVGAHVRRALKQHVLEQMGEARSPRALIGRADVIPQIDRDDGRGVIFGKGDAQPVVELERFDWNPH